MTRYLTGIVLMGLYLGWVLYRLIIKKDLLQHKEEFYTATFFLVIMVCTYWLISR
ncbi:MAG: hypothetical protein IPK99_08800 [Flavobacteriales bacterium]|nr:hypothetical protein [Flavobacteriales bacterium]